MLSTYPPTQCGLATFSASLLAHLPAPGDHVGVVRVLDGPARTRPPEVVHDLVNGSADGTEAAAEVLNGYDVAIVQHEYGIYGGDDGKDLIPLLSSLKIPSIVVLHTVLGHPSPSQRMVLDEISEAASAVVTMTQTARLRLLNIYGTNPAKVSVIGHGAADNRVTPAPKRTGKARAVTWGLLGPGKGIEHAIDAVALLRVSGISLEYVVAGQTHPRVMASEGEAYRQSLEERARARHIGDLVHFDPRYLPAGSLGDLISSADVVILPYENLEQVTSGVLIEAVAAGKPVVGTCFPHAVELLASGAGLLVVPGDPGGLAKALRRVLTEPGLCTRMSRHAGDLAPQFLWPTVAASYRELADSVSKAPVSTAPVSKTPSGKPPAGKAPVSKLPVSDSPPAAAAVLGGSYEQHHKQEQQQRRRAWLPATALPAPAADERRGRPDRARQRQRARGGARLLRGRHLPRAGHHLPGAVAVTGADRPGPDLPALPGGSAGAGRAVHQPARLRQDLERRADHRGPLGPCPVGARYRGRPGTGRGHAGGGASPVRAGRAAPLALSARDGVRRAWRRRGA
jgi:glycosyltransferase involved in cell wall biosynthesis